MSDVAPRNPLVAVMFATLAAEMADPDRFRRGRTYQRQQAVHDVLVGAGAAEAEVQGSRSEPYRVTLRVRPVRRAAVAAAAAGRLNVLVPRPEDLTIACSCPDWGAPCKHGVAALLALGEELAAHPDDLVRWRQGDGVPVGDDAADGGPDADADGDADDDPVAVWLGRGYDPDPPGPLPPFARRPRTGHHDDNAAALVAAAVDDARAALARAFGPH